MGCGTRRHAGTRGGTVPCFVAAIGRCGIADALHAASDLPKSSNEFDDWHLGVAGKLLAALQESCPAATFGHAAKALAICLKTMVIVGPAPVEPFASLVHPPVDDILLDAIAADKSLPKPLRRTCRLTKWTQLDAATYSALIHQLRQQGLDQPNFWMLERYWTISR